MIRWLIVLAALVSTSGCASTYRGYDNHQPVRVGGSSYYAPAYAGSYGHERGDHYRGDYYYSRPVRSYDYPIWYENPYYFSLFWPLQRSFYDPFWNPGFYYGVTWFPRHYFSLSLYGGPRYASRWGHGYYGIGLAYSPYRLSWVDHYYDWYPYYRHYPRHVHHWYAPRYGNARHEAERLASFSRGLPRTDTYGAYRANRDPVRSSARDADYHGRTAARIDPGVRGFDRPERAAVGQRRADYGTDARTATGRIDPGVRGFNRGDARVDAAPRGADRGEYRTHERRIDPAVRGFDRARGVADHSARGQSLDRSSERDPSALRGHGRDAGYRVVDTQRAARREAQESYALPGRAVQPARHAQPVQQWSPSSRSAQPVEHIATRPPAADRSYRPAPEQPVQYRARPDAPRQAQYAAPPPAQPYSAPQRAQHYAAPAHVDRGQARAAYDTPSRPAAAAPAPAPRSPAPARGESRSDSRSDARSESRSASRLDRR
jgi:hypothetical protein